MVFPIDTPELKKYVLVLFSYIGCSTACTSQMEKIAAIYQDFIQNSKTDKLSVLCVNLKEMMPTREADVYGRGFYPKFMGVI